MKWHSKFGNVEKTLDLSRVGYYEFSSYVPGVGPRLTVVVDGYPITFHDREAIDLYETLKKQKELL